MITLFLRPCVHFLAATSCESANSVHSSWTHGVCDSRGCHTSFFPFSIFREMGMWYALLERWRAYSLKIENSILLLHGWKMKTSFVNVSLQGFCFSPGVASLTVGDLLCLICNHKFLPHCTRTWMMCPTWKMTLNTSTLDHNNVLKFVLIFIMRINVVHTNFSTRYIVGRKLAWSGVTIHL